MDATHCLVLFVSLVACSLTNAQLLEILADNVTVSYQGTATLRCLFTIDSTYNSTSNSSQDVKLVIEELQRIGSSLNRPELEHIVTGNSTHKVYSVTVENVLLADEGVFVCSATATVTATDYEESKAAYFTLSITDYYKLILSVSAPDVSVMHNSQAVLKCSVETNETAVLNTGSSVKISIVTIDGSPVVHTSLTESHNGSYSNKSLVIGNAQDSAVYQCIVTIGEEREVHNFTLAVILNVTSSSNSASSSATASLLSSAFLPPPSASPSVVPPSNDDDGIIFGIGQTLLLIIVLAVIIGITIFILVIVACYFIIANMGITCYSNKDEMRMDRMDKKMRKNEKLTSLYNQELGEYAKNQAYNLEMDEEEMIEIVEERESWDGPTHKENKTRHKKRNKKKRGNFVVQDQTEMTDTHQWKKKRNQSNDRHHPYSHRPHRPAATSKRSHDHMSHSSDQSDYSDTEANNGRVPQGTNGRVRKSSLKGTEERPKLKKKVSMGSVEIIDDEGEVTVPIRVEFNDQDEEDIRQYKKILKEKNEYPQKEKKGKQPLKTMDDIMDHLESARKAPTYDNQTPSLEEVEPVISAPNKEMLPPLTTRRHSDSAPMFKPPLSHDRDQVGGGSSTPPITRTNTDNRSDLDEGTGGRFPWRKRSLSLHLPAGRSGGKETNHSRPRASSVRKPGKASKTSSAGKIYGGTGNLDVFY